MVREAVQGVTSTDRMGGFCAITAVEGISTFLGLLFAWNTAQASEVRVERPTK